MQRRRTGLSWRTISGPAVQVGDRTITPRLSALTLRVRGHAAIVWTRPVGVDVAQAGAVRRMRIVDYGRLAWIGLGGMLALLVVVRAAASPRKERNE